MKLRGLRGSAFEDMINRTIEEYRQKKLALIKKTSIKKTQSIRVCDSRGIVFTSLWLFKL